MRWYGLGAIALLWSRDAAAQAAYGDAAKNAAPKAPTVGTDDTAAATPTEKKFNNEGTFKISGTSGVAKKTTKTAATTSTSKKKIASTAIVAQWPGFRATDDGGSEVMVEFSKNPTAPTEHKAAGSVTYVFKGAHVIKSNNQNPLITVHFNTPLASARLVPKKDELHLVIEFRAGANATATSGVRASSDGDGQQFFVKFPAGSWLPKGAENEEMPPPPTQKPKNKATDKPGDKPAASSAPPPKSATGAKTGPAP